MQSSIRKTLTRYYPGLELTDLQHVDQGLSNYNYKAWTNCGDKVFIKVFRLANASTIEREIRLIEYLRQAGIAVPGIVRARSGAPYVTMNGFILAIYEYLDGPYPEASAGDVLKIGMLAASMHKLIVPDYIRPGYKVSHAGLKDQIFHDLIHITTPERKLLSQALDHCRPVATSQTPNGLIHTDVFLDNCIKTQDSTIYLLDFEETAFDCFLLDIGRALLGCCSTGGCIDFEIARHLLQGYTKIRGLSAKEWSELYEWLIFSILLSITWRYIEFNQNRPTEGRQSIYRTFIPSLEAVLDLGKNGFLDRVYLARL